MYRKLAALGFGLISFNFLFFPFREGYVPQVTMPGLGTLWFFLATVAAQIFLLILFYKPQSSRKQHLALGSSTVAVLASLLAMYHANGVDQLLMSGVAAGGTLLSLYLFSLTHDEFGALSEVVFLPLHTLFNWLNGTDRALSELPELGKTFSRRRKMVPSLHMNQEVMSGVVRGVVIAVPVIGVLGLLLLSADPIFAHMVQNLFQFQLPNFPTWLVYRTTLSVLFLLFIAPTAWVANQQRFASPFQRAGLKEMRVESLVLGVSVAALLGVFLLIQFRYLFTTVSETELHQFGVQTYSEYVKKGFGELLLVSVIVYLVAGFNMVVHRMTHEKGQGLLRKINVLLLVETLIFIFSIMRRVWLYQASHGLSRIRVYGMAFLIMMFIFTVILILRHYKKWMVEWYVLEVLTFVVIVFGVFFMNVDQSIATQFKPTVNDRVDYSYIVRLSPDAIEGWQEAYAHAKSVLMNPKYVVSYQFSEDEVREVVYAGSVVNRLSVERNRLKQKYEGVNFSLIQAFTPEIKQFNFAENQAYQTAKNTIFTQELDTLLNKAEELNSLIVSTKQSVPLDRSTQSPLVR